MVTAFNEFLNWEASSRDTIDFKKIYVDIAGSDVLAGLLLSELVYWYLPSKNGTPNKIRVEKDDKEWIACTRYEWWERTRMSPREVDRAIKILADSKIIEKHVYRFGGSPTVHIRLNQDVFIAAWDKYRDEPLKNPFLPIRDNEVGFNESVKSKSRKREMQITKTDKTLTENTTATTTKKKKQSVVPITPVTSEPAIAASLPLAAQTDAPDAIEQAESHLSAVEADEQSKLETFYSELAKKAPDETIKASLAECLKSYPYTDICSAIQFVHNAPLPKPRVMEVLERWEFEKAMENPDKAPKPKRANPMYDAIFSVWGFTEALNTDYAKFLTGKATKKQHKPCNLSPAVSPEELLAWAEWYKSGHTGKDGKVFMIESPARIQNSINEYRRSKQPIPVVTQQGEPPKPVTISEMIDTESFVKREREKLRLAKEQGK